MRGNLRGGIGKGEREGSRVREVSGKERGERMMGSLWEEAILFDYIPLGEKGGEEEGERWIGSGVKEGGDGEG